MKDNAIKNKLGRIIKLLNSSNLAAKVIKNPKSLSIDLLPQKNPYQKTILNSHKITASQDHLKTLHGIGSLTNYNQINTNLNNTDQSYSPRLETIKYLIGSLKFDEKENDDNEIQELLNLWGQKEGRPEINESELILIKKYKRQLENEGNKYLK